MTIGIIPILVFMIAFVIILRKLRSKYKHADKIFWGIATITSVIVYFTSGMWWAIGAFVAFFLFFVFFLGKFTRTVWYYDDHNHRKYVEVSCPKCNYERPDVTGYRVEDGEGSIHMSCPRCGEEQDFVVQDTVRKFDIKF